MRHPGVITVKGYSADSMHAHAAAVSAADNAALRENGQRLLAVADSAVQHQHDMIEAACAPLRERVMALERDAAWLREDCMKKNQIIIRQGEHIKMYQVLVREHNN
jgi:hypothetical protein